MSVFTFFTKFWGKGFLPKAIHDDVRLKGMTGNIQYSCCEFKR